MDIALEIAAENYGNNFSSKDENGKWESLEAKIEHHHAKDSFIKGVEWQKERSYTDEEVQEILLRFKSDVITNHHAQVTNSNPYQWFKQFKKEKDGEF